MLDAIRRDAFSHFFDQTNRVNGLVIELSLDDLACNRKESKCL